MSIYAQKVCMVITYACAICRVIVVVKMEPLGIEYTRLDMTMAPLVYLQACSESEVRKGKGLH